MSRTANTTTTSPSPEALAVKAAAKKFRSLAEFVETYKGLDKTDRAWLVARIQELEAAEQGPDKNPLE